jgi:hypothetical protein
MENWQSLFDVMKMPKKLFTILRNGSDRSQHAATLTNARRSMDHLSCRISSLDPFSQDKVPYVRDVGRSASPLYQKTRAQFDISVKGHEL